MNKKLEDIIDRKFIKIWSEHLPVHPQPHFVGLDRMDMPPRIQWMEYLESMGMMLEPAGPREGRIVVRDPSTALDVCNSEFNIVIPREVAEKMLVLGELP